MSDTGTTSATWKGTVDGRLPKNQRNKLLVEAEAYGLTLNDLAATCEEFGVAPSNLLNELSRGFDLRVLRWRHERAHRCHR